jgi:hypothetical protein
VTVHGVRMIAPADASPAVAATALDCCCSDTSAQSPAGDPPADRRPPYPGRTRASGLIQGLRGLAPFDDSRFPPLPWGGARMASSDIQLIADWIDDGCPAEDRDLATFALEPDAGAASGAVMQTIRADNVEAVVQDTTSTCTGGAS